MGQPTERDEALDTPEDAAASSADAPTPGSAAGAEGRPDPADAGGSTAEGEPASGTSAAPGQEPEVEDDDVPYVPRVFAFDPDVPAVLHPPAPDAAPEPEPSAASEETADDAPAVVAQGPAPAHEQPAASSDAPVTAPQEPAPAVQEPTVEQPTVEQPVVEEPAVGRAAAEEPATEEPVVTAEVPSAVEAAPAPTAAVDRPVAPADEPAPAPEDEPSPAPAGEASPVPEAATAPSQPDVAAPSDPSAETPAGTSDADDTRVVPVVAPAPAPSEPSAAAQPVAAEPPAEASVAEPPAATAEPAGPEAAADATQVLPPVEPWERPGPVRTSVLPTSSDPGTAEPAPDAAPTGDGGDDVPGAAGGAAGPFGPVPPDEERVTSPFDGFEEDAPRRGWVRGLVWTGVAVLVLGGLYAAAQWYFSDKVPNGTTVAGVEIGGMTRGDAQAELEAALGPRAAEPVTLTAGEATTTMDPAAAGLTFDAEATAEELTTFSMNPVRLWDHLVGGGEEEPVVRVDDAALDAQVETLRGSLEAEPVDGTVQFVDGAPTATPAADGTELVADTATQSIVEGWLVTDGPIELETQPVGPEVTQEETDAALAEAQQVVSAPVVVSVGDQSAELPVEVLAGAASYTPTGGELALTFDGALLVEAVVERTDDLLTAADDAHFEFEGGVPVIRGGEPGTTIDPAAISEGVATAATATDRTATVELVQSDPEQSVAALEALGVKEKVAEFSTPLTNNALRTENLRVGAAKVDGTLVLPGETFSLTETLSPITTAGGYHSAGIVENGRHVDGVGGGLSQMATTTYNAAFFAGLEDVEHRQHSYWFSRYPAGREATIYVGAIDLKFKNDTPYGVLMQSWVGGGELHVAVWSTKHFEVETSASQRSNVVPPTTVTQSGPDCAPTPAGNPGFTITNYRKVYLDGELVKDEADRWTYKPDNEVVCAP